VPLHDSIVPRGFCQCGCGERTRLAPGTDASKGWVKNQPLRFVFGHSRKNLCPDYRVEDRGFVTPCWIWQRKLKNGYGMVGSRRAHRVFYETSYGPIDANKEPDHLCKVKACVRPDHLEPTTHAENVRRGPHTKLSMEIARRIRADAATGLLSYTEIGRQNNASVQTVSLIVKNKQWREIDHG
jgi:hypothetical protein